MYVSYNTLKAIHDERVRSLLEYAQSDVSHEHAQTSRISLVSRLRNRVASLRFRVNVKPDYVDELSLQ